VPDTSHCRPGFQFEFERSFRPVAYHWRVRRWVVKHPGRSWLSEDFVHSLERGPKRRGISSSPRSEFERSEPRAEQAQVSPNHHQ